MAKVHCLKTGGGATTSVIHYLTPAGSNSASITWANAIVASGNNKTILTTGTGVGQISSAEAAQIAAGEVIEVITDLQIDSSGGSAAQVLPTIERVIAEDKLRLAASLKWYGRSEGTVS